MDLCLIMDCKEPGTTRDGYCESCANKLLNSYFVEGEIKQLQLDQDAPESSILDLIKNVGKHTKRRSVQSFRSAWMSIKTTTNNDGRVHLILDTFYNPILPTYMRKMIYNRDLEIITLKAQIESLKCCGNCKYCDCKHGHEDLQFCMIADYDFNCGSVRDTCDKWEIRG